MTRSLPDPRQPLPAVRLLAGAPVRLLLTSATLLFVELLLIRWIPANVRYVGFFSNFLLMASFLGIGIGILLGRRALRLPLSPFPLLLLATLTLVYSAQLNVQAQDPSEFNFGLHSSTSADVNFVVLPLLIVLVTALMATLALPLGPLLRSMPPLRAYGIDIAGSMLGIVGFAALAYLGTAPSVWFAVVAALLCLMALGVGPTAWSLVSGAAMVVVIGTSAAAVGANFEAWSPYYRITAVDEAGQLASTDPSHGRPPRWLFVDGIPHQQMVDAETAARSSVHRQAYAWFPGRTFERVLIIGAGTGTDTALALARGATHIDAVEIDPTLAQVGRDFHPEGVYDDPRVTVYVNDGRAFLNQSRDRYDLVVYALTDSLTLVSSTVGVRLESFLFTEESFAAAREHLAPDGLFVVYNLYREPWLISKLDRMLGNVFGQRLVRLPSGVEAVLAAGPAVTALGGGPPPGDNVDIVPPVGQPDPKPATDDWPFLYLRTTTVAPYYLAALAFILVLALVAVLWSARATSTPVRRFSPHFFVLGVAFLLLETKSLVSFSLLFGTTWVVNALTFFAILASVLLAILVNARIRWRSPVPLYAALLVAIAVAYLVPAEALLIDPPAVRYAVASAISFAPVFFANLVFTHSFRDTTSADMAFASNLLGAMVGGALEYVALIAGFRALLLVVAVLYVIAFITRRLRLLADRDMVDERMPAIAAESPA
jgi:SAM-dependent methyltransferase